MSSAKFLDIVDIIKRRIEIGDYAIIQLPSERSLAEEMGVSHMTARRAVQYMLENNILERSENGKLVPHKSYNEKKEGRVALLLADWHTASIYLWRHMLVKEVTGRGMNIKSVVYQHIDDPVIFDTLSGDFDLIFMYIPQVTPTLEARLLAVKDKVVSFFNNLSHMGIRCIDGVPDKAIGMLVKQLRDYGHRNAAFFNFDPVGNVISRRIELWKEFAGRMAMDCEYYNFPVSPFEDSSSKAYEKTISLLRKGKPEFTAVFCTTVNDALAVNRAFYDCGYKVGKDISLCSFGEYRKARYSVPSITVVDGEGHQKLFKRLLNDFSPEGGWLSDKLEYNLGAAKLFAGESIGRIGEGVLHE